MENGTATQTALLSGSTGGIGKEIAQILAQQGYELILVNRSAEKSMQQQQDLLARFPNVTTTAYTADLLKPSDIVRVCEQVSQQHRRLAAIYNIAGLLTDQRVTTAEGIEGHFAVNTIAPYLLTQGLRQQLREGALPNRPSVVVNFGSSAVHSVKTLDVAALSEPDNPGGLMGAYATSKLALMAVTLAMNTEDSEARTLFQSVDPGPTKTAMTRSGDGMPWWLRPFVPFLFKAPDVAARRLVDAVQQSVDDQQGGLFFAQGRPTPYPALARDQRVQSELLDRLLKLTSRSHT